MQEFDITNRQIQLTIVLKLNQLQRLQYPNLTYDNLVDVLVDLKWKSYPISAQKLIVLW